MARPKEKALKKEAEGDSPATTPVEETKPTGEALEALPDIKVTAKIEGEPKKAKTGRSSKKGFSQRVRELNTKAKEAEARAQEAETKAQSLAEKLEELTGQVDQQAEMQPPFEPQVEPGSEISPDQYKQDVMRTADSLVQLRIKQQNAINRINSEAGEAIRKHPQLDPDSKKFNKELSDSVTEAVEAHVRANPYSASVKKFVDKLMKPYQRAVTNEVGKVTEKIAKQESETALRPTQHKATEKKFEELPIDQMEKKLGFVH